MSVWFYASRPHFADHLEPVWTAGKRYGWMPALWNADLSTSWINARDLYVTASYDDMVKLRNKGAKRVVLMEHGAGQSYSDRHTSYVGGKGRERCPLVLVPNEQAAARHRKFYADRVPVEVVGCPKLDEWVKRPPKPRANPPHVVISFHWRCSITREAGTVWDDYGWDAVMALAMLRDAGEVNLTVHSHPRIIEEVRGAFAGRPDINVIGDFGSVVDVADLYVCDNSSTMFEFAALDRPVVVMNSPRWRRKVSHGGRFWDWEGVGIGIDGPEGLLNAVLTSLGDPPTVIANRHDVVSEVYPFLGAATERAVAAIRRVEVG